MLSRVFGSRIFSSLLAAVHSRLIGRLFLPMLLSLPGIGIGMIIDMCHISVVYRLEIKDVSEIVVDTMSVYLEAEGALLV